MGKEILMPSAPEKESPERRSARISREAKAIFYEETTKNVGALSKKKPSLDFYDSKREQYDDGKDVKYEGRFGKFKEN